jgi:hypothetical protein
MVPEPREREAMARCGASSGGNICKMTFDRALAYERPLVPARSRLGQKKSRDRYRGRARDPRTADRTGSLEALM